MIYTFQEVSKEMTPSVGGKAANLGECARAGFPVPSGFVVPTDCYLQATEAIAADLAKATSDGDTVRARQLVASAVLPDDLASAISAAYATLGEPPVAVRSSATAEDLEHASFAGQQDTYLSVKGTDEVLDAIRRCWVSLWTDRAIDYRRVQQVSSDGLALAVVVQEMVKPDTAGVLFTRNPMSGSDEMMVSSAYGLGESVVAALVTPDTFTVARAPFSVVELQIGSKATRIDSIEGGGTKTSAVPREDQLKPSLDDAQLRELADLGRRVEDHYGHGQDIEWAFADGVLYLLQARPITTGQAEEHGHTPVTGRAARAIRDDLIEHYPAPYPLDLWAVTEVQSVMQNMMRSAGMIVPDAEQVISGDADGIIRISAKCPHPRVSILCDLPRTVRASMKKDPQQWPSRRAALQKRLAALQEDISCAENSSDEHLLATVDAAVAAAADVTDERFRNYLVPMVILRSEAAFFLKWAGLSSTFSVEDFYEGLDYVTAQVTEALNDLVASSREMGVSEIITTVPTEHVQQHLKNSSQGLAFLREVQSFLGTWGARTPRMYLPFSNRSWRENPESLFSLLAVAIRGENAGTQQAGNVIDKALERLPRVVHGRFLRVVERLRGMHVAREGTLYVIEEFFCLARLALDEVAHRLVKRGVLSQVDDLRYLYSSEVRAALTEHKLESLLPVVKVRCGRRGTAEALWWDRGDSACDGDVIQGIPGSAGKSVGTARIVRSPEDFQRLQPGDVLVCPYTDPTWTPLFGIARAVVADTGGPLSHAAIVAREYGIPAVLGTQSGTSRLPDGVSVLVDGTVGTVRVETDASK